MSQIINKVRDVDPNDNDAVKEVLSSFFHNLSNYIETDCNIWLKTLENVINRFPKFCTSHRSTIETYLTKFLESNQYYHVIFAAKCAHVLQQVKPSQDKASTPQACWREQTSLLCNAGRSLIDAVFAGSVNIYKNNDINQKMEVKLLNGTPLTKALMRISKDTKKGKDGPSKIEMQMAKLKNVFIFLQAMLVEIYPVAKPIRPQIILEVIMQVLSVTGNTEDTSDLLASVKIQALRTLDALIACLGSNLIPYSPLVFRFTMQTLRWTSETTCKEFSKVRVSAYNSLSKWLHVLNVHRPSHEGRGRLWEDELTSYILDDIIPQKKLIQLTMSSQPNKKLSKKAKRRIANTMLQDSTIASHIPGQKNKINTSEEMCENIAIAALECAETFLTVCGIFIKPATHKIFQERLVQECCCLSMYSAERGLRLLRVLDATRKAVPPGVPPPTQYCLHLYSRLINTCQGEIHKFCSNALLDIRLHLHCSPASLTFAIDVQSQTKKKAEFNKKIMSERNRSVLNSLLGAERMPSEYQQIDVDNEEIISIPDEPSNKRPRLDSDINDQISLSSDSIQSVELSNDIKEMSSDYELPVTKDITEFSPIEEESSQNKDETSDLAEEHSYIDEVTSEDKSKEAEQIENEDITTNDQSNNDGSIVGNNERNLDGIEVINEEINVINEVVDKEKCKDIIHEVEIQLPLNDIMDDDETPLSLEVAYDYPNTCQEKLTVLDNTDYENLPSSNDTDDIQITCGQDVKSQGGCDKNIEIMEQEVEKNNDSIVSFENGINDLSDNNDGNIEIGACVDISFKTVEGTEVKALEDMLADFVDEVNEEKNVEA